MKNQGGSLFVRDAPEIFIGEKNMLSGICFKIFQKHKVEGILYKNKVGKMMTFVETGSWIHGRTFCNFLYLLNLKFSIVKMLQKFNMSMKQI